MRLFLTACFHKQLLSVKIGEKIKKRTRDSAPFVRIVRRV
ncbi:hypothetical protein HMPREF1325_0653 [Treponema socranskii subsp. socranskii VPI DR56BR1116 = ATCC 35536]|uniref:Uncharacterized protein n=1 Tax=Treponema socranskii subsp. socranskii VPI DR56BR1116 = ATCC 35536 TaxID=1125725 RepID=U1F7F0_TRESO|nr:hypothetical protein HMPREF1325_0653 [Treponema socranskii subsp. socranskii VPI DR56BR1116 = ATCC 35536]